MERRSKFLRQLRYIFTGTVLSVLVFFSISFLSYLMDLDTFNTSASSTDFSVSIGFPFTYYGEVFLPGNNFPTTSASFLNLILDCVITWIIVALPYVFYKNWKNNRKNNTQRADLIDQNEI